MQQMQTLSFSERIKLLGAKNNKLYKAKRPTKKEIAKIPLTAEEHQKLIMPVRESMEKIFQGTQTANDWYIVTFRMKIGLMVAERLYGEQNIQTLKAGIAISDKMLELYEKDKDYNWKPPGLGAYTIKEALDLVEEIQTDADRETLIFCTRAVYNEMIKYAEG